DRPSPTGTSLHARQDAGDGDGEQGAPGKRAGLRAAFEDRPALLELLAVNRLKADAVAREKNRRRIVVRIEQAHGGAADQPPSARRLPGVDAGVAVPDADAAGRDPRARSREPRRVELGGESRHV